MTAAPAVMETLSVPMGFDRRGRGMTRHRSYRLHIGLVLIARNAWTLWGRPLPGYIRPCGMRTVYPPRTPC